MDHIEFRVRVTIQATGDISSLECDIGQFGYFVVGVVEREGTW